MPIFALYAYQGEVNVSTLLLLRFSLAAIIFFTYLKISRVKARITKSQLLSLFLLGGVLYTLQSSFYFSSLQYIPASLTALLLYTYPAFVALLSFIFDKEKLGTRMIGSIAISLAGLTMVLGTSFGEINLFGMLLALAAAITYSFYILLGNRVVRELPPPVTSAYVALFAALSFATIGTVTDGISFDFKPVAWAAILGVVLFSTLLAMFFFFRGLELIGSTKASILSTIEPLVTIGFSALLFHEWLTPLQAIGGIAVLIGAMLVVFVKNRVQEDVAEHKSAKHQSV